MGRVPQCFILPTRLKEILISLVMTAVMVYNSHHVTIGWNILYPALYISCTDSYQVMSLSPSIK